MKILTEDIIHFFQKQGFVIVSTVDTSGCPHNSCKGVVHMDPDGHIYLLDLYKGQTHRNLEENPHISITAVDEHKFTGYSLKGVGSIVPQSKIKSHLIKTWEEKIAARVSRRVIKEVKEGETHTSYPEIVLPKPEYMIVMKAEEILDLSPRPFQKTA
jgi:predicted pyridoxine 5'-phosphate oxidase superfamily flavin-nucleotide-binding protein